jgi:hypothetical protein
VKRKSCKYEVARIHNWVITNQPNLQPARRRKRMKEMGKKKRLETEGGKWQQVQIIKVRNEERTNPKK